MCFINLKNSYEVLTHLFALISTINFSQKRGLRKFGVNCIYSTANIQLKHMIQDQSTTQICRKVTTREQYKCLIRMQHIPNKCYHPSNSHQG